MATSVCTIKATSQRILGVLSLKAAPPPPAPCLPPAALLVGAIKRQAVPYSMVLPGREICHRHFQTNTSWPPVALAGLRPGHGSVGGWENEGLGGYGGGGVGGGTLKMISSKVLPSVLLFYVNSCSNICEKREKKKRCNCHSLMFNCETGYCWRKKKDL